MKTSTFCLLIAALLLTSCQNEATGSNQEEIWKKKTTVDKNGPVASNDPDDPNKTTDAPIDGGLSILLLGGAAYGARKVYKSRNKEVNP